jgi:Tfp pilus assembly protein PilV
VARGRQFRGVEEEGFSLLEVMIAMLVLITAIFSLTYVLVNSLADTAYARQRVAATNLANQTLEEVRALPWSVIEGGMNATELTANGTYCGLSQSSCDPNLAAVTVTVDGVPSTGYCFEGYPLDVGTAGGSVVAGSSTDCANSGSTASTAWSDPDCLSVSSSHLGAPPSATSLYSPAPIYPHQACYTVGSLTYAVDVYLTGVAGATYPGSQPLTATVVVTWGRPLRQGLSDHVVSTTVLSPCLKGGAEC